MVPRYAANALWLARYVVGRFFGGSHPAASPDRR